MFSVLNNSCKPTVTVMFDMSLICIDDMRRFDKNSSSAQGRTRRLRNEPGSGDRNSLSQEGDSEMLVDSVLKKVEENPQSLRSGEQIEKVAKGKGYWTRPCM